MFAEWNKGELDSFLIEITANILKFKDTDGKCGWKMSKYIELIKLLYTVFSDGVFLIQNRKF